MADRTSIEPLLDQLTAGMSDDPEMMLDIRAELAAHFEESVEAFKADGFSEAESVAKALEAFGDTDEIAAGLQDANRGQAGSRAMIRLLVKRVMVPAAVIVAMFGAAHFAERASRLSTGLEKIQSSYPLLPGQQAIQTPSFSLLLNADPISRLSDEDAFIFHGDQKRLSRSQAQRAIWEAQPESPVFFANYISELLIDPQAERDQLEADLQVGLDRFGDNARYHFLHAAVQLQQLQTKAGLSDDELFEERRGVFQAYRQGAAQPLYMRYSLEMLMNRLGKLKPVRYLEDQVERFRVIDMVPDADHVYLEYLLGQLAPHARQLHAEGADKEAVDLLNSWQTVLFHFSHDAVSINDIYSIQRMASVVQNDLIPVIHEIGGTEAAEAAAHQALMVQNLIFNESGQYQADLGRFNKEMLSGASLYSKVTAPIIQKFPYPGVLENYRQAEHVILEQFAVLLAIGLAFLMLISAAVLSFRWRRSVRGAGPGMLILSRGRLIRLVGLGIIIPLGLVVLYTRSTSLAGREFGFTALPERFLMELVFFAILVLTVCSWMAERMIRARCSELSLTLPRHNFQLPYFLLWSSMAALWAIGMGMQGENSRSLGILVNGGLIVVAAVGVGALLRFGWQFFGSRQLGAYYGAVSNTLMPVYAGIIILLGLVVLPFLERQELEYLSNERQYAEFQKGGFSNMEYAHVKELRDRLDRLKQTPAEDPAEK